MKTEKLKVATEVKTDPMIDGKPSTRRAEFTYDTPENMEEAVKAYGEEAVFNEFIKGLIVTIQAPARKTLTGMASGLTKEEYSVGVQEVMTGWKLGQKTSRVSSPEDLAVSLASMWSSLSPERQAEIMAKFTGGAPAVSAPDLIGIDDVDEMDSDELEPVTVGRRPRH